MKQFLQKILISLQQRISEKDSIDYEKKQNAFEKEVTLSFSVERLQIEFENGHMIQFDGFNFGEDCYTNQIFYS